MPDLITQLANLINPEVMADMISAKVDKKIRVTPYAKLDTTLQGNAGDTITIPKYTYIGDAVDVAEGEEIPTRQLGVTSAQYQIKKAGLGGILTDEAVLSAHGNPVGEMNSQIAKAIASKADNDAVDELYKASTAFIANAIVGYNGIVDAIDIYEDEEDGEKVMFIHPKQKTQIRKDADFKDRSKYGNDELLVSGEIGQIAGVRVVVSKKVKLFESWYKMDSNGSVTVSSDNLATVQASLPLAKVGDKVTLVSTPAYFNPIVKLEEDNETEDASPALTVFLKRETNVETERVSKKRLTEVTADRMYTVALTNDTKVIIAKFNKVASV